MRNEAEQELIHKLRSKSDEYAFPFFIGSAMIGTFVACRYKNAVIPFMLVPLGFGLDIVTDYLRCRGLMAELHQCRRESISRE